MPPADPAAAVVAILRGLTPDRALSVGSVLRGAGIRILEVPLNSPDPYKSIEILAAESGGDCLVGAGTVLSPEQVERTHAAGGRLVVSPNTNPAVIRAALTRGMQVMPGFATASEEAGVPIQATADRGGWSRESPVILRYWRSGKKWGDRNPAVIIRKATKRAAEEAAAAAAKEDQER